MSSPDEVSLRGAGLGPESGEHAEGRRFGHGFPKGHGLGPGERLLRSSDDKMCFPVPKSFHYDSWLDRDDMEGRSVIWGCEGRPGTPVDERGDNLDFVQQLAVEGTSFGQHVANREAWGVCRHPSPQICPAEPLSIWGDSDASISRRGARPPNSVEGKQFSVSQLHHCSVSQLNPRGLGRSRAWVTPRRGTARRINSEDIQNPSSDPESSDEFSEIQTMRVTICLKEGVQAKSIGLSEPEEKSRYINVHGRESCVPVPHSILSSATRGLISGLEKQASGELEGTMYKKKQSIVWGKEGSRHSYPGAAAICAAAPATAASGALPKTSPRKKPGQEMSNQWDASRGPLGRTFPPWGQRLKSAPVGPATLPPISGVALLGKGSKCSLPSGPKECKPFCTGKKSTAKKNKESQSGAKEDNDAPRDLGQHAQPGCGGKWAWLPVWVTGVRRALTVWAALLGAEQPGVFMHRGDMVSGDTNFRVPQFPANSQLVALSQRGTRPRAPVPIGDQDRPMSSLLFVGESQPVVQGTPGCPQCLMLQKEIENLKEQLAVMKALNEKFQDL